MSLYFNWEKIKEMIEGFTYMDRICTPSSIFREERIKENQNTHCKIIAFRFVDAIENSTEISWEN